MAFTVRHFHVKTKDEKKTADWWVENFGAKIVGRTHGTGYQVELDGVTFNVTTMVDFQVREQYYGLEHLAIHTEDKSDVDKLLANGARLLEESPIPELKLNVYFMETPEGVMLEVSFPLE